MYIHVLVQYIHSVDAAIGWPSKHAGHPLLYAALPDAVQSPGTVQLVCGLPHEQ